MEDGRLFDIIDAQVKGNCNEKEAIVIANIAKKCLNLNGRNRPTMREVAMKLEGILLSRRGINIQQIGEVDESSTSISCSSFEIGIDLPFDSNPSTSPKTWLSHFSILRNQSHHQLAKISFENYLVSQILWCEHADEIN
ncbi:hypothetical protein OIU74_014078 [Salix koriyanagi]|uniref:Uncharacterized protein n=1 Tax=Salix koriyanagi TaxID=2511006 RepID=A0A9Q0PUZ3_9ROSI|nr:hypothetical protein OIU74_014078 [Salix koriyanagi]